MGLLSSIGSAFFSEYQRNQQNTFNAQEADKARRYNSEMFDKANQYNSPANQKKLLKEAGLNPNMLYAQGGIDMSAQMGTTSQQAAASMGSSASIDGNVLESINQAQDLDLKSLDIERQKVINKEEQVQLDILKKEFDIKSKEDIMKGVDVFFSTLDKFFTKQSFREFIGNFSTNEHGEFEGMVTDVDNENYKRILNNFYFALQSKGLSSHEMATHIDEMNAAISKFEQQVRILSKDADKAEVFQKIINSIQGFKVFGYEVPKELIQLLAISLMNNKLGVN